MSISRGQIEALASAIAVDVKALEDAVAALQLSGGAVDAMIYKGAINASTNPNYPASNAGDTYRISVSGKIGGASGVNVEVGDILISHTDNSSAGTQAAVGGNWDIIQTNIDGAMTVAGGTFVGDINVPDEAYGSSWNGSTEAPTKNSLYDKIETIVAGGGAETTSSIGALIAGANDKSTPADSDTLALSDSASSNILRKLTWTNIKATLKTYFDTFYQPLSGTLSSWANKTVPSGSVVGTTDTQTLTNKTLTSPVISTIINTGTLTLPTTTGTLALTSEITGGGTIEYISNHGSNLTTALTAIGSTNKTLVIDTNISYSGTATIPATTRVAFANNAILTITSGVLTITNLEDPGDVKCFAGAGDIIIAYNAVDHLNLGWWSGVSYGQDVTSFFPKLFYSLENNLASGSNQNTGYAGGQLFIPHQYCIVTSAINIPSRVTIYGRGREHTTIKQTTANTAIFLIGELKREIEIRGVRLSGEGVTGVTGLLCTGNSPNTTSGVGAIDCSFWYCNIGVDLLSINVGWEIIRTYFDNCIFTFCNKGIRCNSENSSQYLNKCWFYLPSSPSGATALHIEHTGGLMSYNHLCFGTGPRDQYPTDGSTFLYTEQSSNVIMIEGGQDENINWFCRTGGYNYLLRVLYFKNNTILSRIQINGTTTFHSQGNRYLDYGADGDNTIVGNYRDIVGVEGVIYSRDDFFDNRNFNNVPINTRQGGYFVGTSYFAVKEGVGEYGHRQYQFQRNILTDSLDIVGVTDNEPVMQIGRKNSYAPMLRIGRKAADGTLDVYHDFLRGPNDGMLEINGNQPYPNRGIKTNGNFECSHPAGGLVLQSPDGNKWLLRLTNAGVLEIVDNY